MTIFYFSSTGNSIQVARAFGGELVSIPAMLKGDRKYWEDDAIGIVTPTHFGAPLRPVTEFLERVSLKCRYLFCIFTCGNTQAGAVSKIRRAAEGRMRFDYINSIKMVDNYFPYFNVRKQVENLAAKHVEEHLKSIVDDVRNRRRYIEGTDLYGKIAGWYMSIFPLSPNAYKRFYVLDEKCDGCGVCRKICPIDNIVMDDDRHPIIRSACLTCGACYHNCPNEAIHYRGEKSDYRYRNADVSLADLLRANDTTAQK